MQARRRRGGESAAAGDGQRGEPVEQRPEKGNGESKDRRGDVGEGSSWIAELLAAREKERVGDENGGTDGERAREGEAAGAEGARKLGLAQAQTR